MNKTRLLIVEDNPVEACEISYLLRQAGFDLKIVGDAESGFACLIAEPFDLLLCDLHLPGENGFSLCRRVKQQEELRHLPVVMLTRYADPLNFLRGLEAGADGFISKGQSEANITGRLRRVLARRRASADGRHGEDSRVVFLDTEFQLPADRDQLLEVLLSGFEDVVQLNAKYEAETLARLAAQQSLQDANVLYLSLVETLPMGVARKDAEGTYTFANRRFCELFGKSINEIIGRKHEDICSPEQAERERDYDRQVIATGKTHEEMIECNRLPGETRSYQLLRAPIWTSIGEIVGVQVVYCDVSELKRAESDLLQAKEAAEAASLAKSDFLANMSHELRTPLNGVIGMSELLSATELSEKQQQFVHACHVSGESLLQILNDILDFSKIEAGKLELDMHEFDLEKLVTDTVETLSWQAMEKGVEMPCFVDGAAGGVLRGDSVRLRQILTNLVGNAVKFTHAGEVFVAAEVRSTESERLTVRFSVADTGIGIPADKRDRLFKSFSQVDSSTTRTYGGTGLGLAISQSLVQLFGGSLGMDSKEGVGSTFWFEVPLDVVSESAGEADPQGPLSGRRILIIDDNRRYRSLLETYVSHWGMTAVTAASVEEARAAVLRSETAGSPFDVVLADHAIRNGSAVDVVRALEAHAIPIVLLLDGNRQDVDAREWSASGIAGKLLKPVRRRELFDAIGSVLAHEVVQPAAGETAARIEPGHVVGHVLLVEDNKINQMYVAEYLTQVGVTCDTTSNGREAIEAVRQRQYDLVLMDCQMPEMDGFAATRQIRRLEAEGTLQGKLPIVALTANAVKGDEERCLDAGMDDYLSKPVQTQQLADVLERYIGAEGAVEEPVTGIAGGETQAGAAPSDPIDVDAFLDRFFGDADFASTMLDELEATGRERVQEIVKSAFRRDAAATAGAAHSLKGAAGLLCAHTIEDIAAEIESLCREDQLHSLGTLIDDLATAMQHCLEDLPNLRERLAVAPREPQARLG